MNEHLEFLLTMLGVCGSTGWAVFGFMLKNIDKNNAEMRAWIQEQFEHYDKQRKILGDVWKEMIRAMQAFDEKVDNRMDALENRFDKCACKRVNDPPSGFP